MRIAIGLENLRSDLDAAKADGRFRLHDYAGDDRDLLRANSLAQLAINPLRLINQRIPWTLNGKPFLDTSKPLEMVHFGSEATVRAAIEWPHEDGGASYDVAHYHHVDAGRVEDPILAELMRGRHELEVPIAIFGLAKQYEGVHREVEHMREWFESVLPGYSETELPNSTLILGESSQENIRDYFGIDRDTWKTMGDLGSEAVEYQYKV